jgi:amino acid permease
MHYNSPRFYTELRNATILRFTIAVTVAFGLSAALYTAIASAGFLTFGGNSDSYILNNYSPHDPLATLCRVAVALSTVTIFPIAFIGFRDGVLDALHIPPREQTGRILNMLTLVLLSLITLIAAVVSDLGLINAVAGGTIAVLVVFALPAMMYRKAVLLLGQAATIKQHYEVVIVFQIMSIGAVLGAVGGIVSVVREA